MVRLCTSLRAARRRSKTRLNVTARVAKSLRKWLDEVMLGLSLINSVSVTADLTSKDSILQLVKEIEQKEPNGIQLLVNNAGVAKEKQTTAFSSQGEPDWQSASAISEHLLKATPESWHRALTLLAD
jgi:NAD(P)-dependent dehydrogenase (short-subunit alcohol dehydrogenase family)